MGKTVVVKAIKYHSEYNVKMTLSETVGMVYNDNHLSVGRTLLIFCTRFNRNVK